MLESLQLQNYRCFDHHEISFRRLNVIVGANNAGKSTLVEALRVLSVVVARYPSLAYNRPPEWTSLSARYLGVSPAMQGVDLRGGSVFHRYGEPPAILRARFVNGESIDLYVGPENQVFAVLFDATGATIASKAEARRTHIPPITILPQIGPLLENESLLSEDHVLRSLDSGLASRHFRNQMHYLRQTYFEDFVQRAEASWHGLHVESLNVEGARPDAVLSLHIRDTDFVAEVGWMGHGLQMWLQTIWFLSRASTQGTVILDEPDVYMHADLQRRLIRLLRGRPGQTVIATHSVEIMSEVDPDCILIVDKKRKQSSFASSLPAVQNTIDRLGGVHNIHLARLWGSQRCLHVEGKDMALLKVIQDTLYPQSDIPFDVIPQLSIGGWGGWSYAVGSSMSLKNAAGQAIATYCIFDSDYHSEEEIARRYEEAHQHGVRLHVWSLKEIENFLIVPAAIVRVIVEGTNGQAIPQVEDVLDACERIVADLRESVFDSLSHEYHVRDRGAGVHGANKRARERIESAWATPAGRVGIVSGKELLSRLSEWAKKTYGVSFGALRLAKELQSHEISSEMRAVVRAIELGQAIPKNLRASER